LNDLLGWILMTMAWASLFLLIALRRLPILVTRLTVRGLGKRIGAEPWNRFHCSGLVNAKEDPIPLTNPDMLVMFGAYDASRQPVRLRCTVPTWDTYWSISLCAWNTDNFFVLNDSAAECKEFDLIIVGSRGSHQKREKEVVVEAPTDRGVIFVRAVVKDRENRDEIARVEQLLNRTTIVPYSQAV
jgi:uncharacterized membrane protein